MLVLWLRRFVFNPLRAIIMSPAKLLGVGRRAGGLSVSLSLAARATIVMTIVLVIIVVIWLVAYWLDPQRSFWRSLFQRPLLLPTVCVLLIAIPILFYHVLRLWLQGDVSPFDDIKAAWKAGIVELERQGLHPLEVPLFLVLGTGGQDLEMPLLDAAAVPLVVRGAPQGDHPIHWYAGPEGIYLCCTSAGCLSRLAILAREGPRAGRPTRDQSPDPTQTVVVPPDSTDTELLGDVGPPDSDENAPLAGAAWARGTMIVDPDASQMSQKGDAGARAQPVSATILPKDVADSEERRMRYLCYLLRQARTPRSPINGILVTVRFGLIQRSADEAVEHQGALRRDLAAVLSVLKLRCRVTVLVTGMEEEPGFQEMTRRVGPDPVAGQRFGKGFPLSSPPLAERIEALAAHACSAFETWIYYLFRQSTALSSPNNHHLYALLCKIRGGVQRRLGDILANAIGCDSDVNPQAEPLFFGGCYFAATGETKDRQAFIRSVLQKQPEEQSELQWTREAIAEDRKLQKIATYIGYLDLLLLALFVGMLVWFFWYQ